MDAATLDRPFGLPADSVEIVLDLPFPVSVNAIWGARNGGGVRRTAHYVRWLEAADMHVMATKQYPRRKIQGPFAIQIALSDDRGGDGDNYIKVCLDWLQSRDVIPNDKLCRKGAWEWVPPAEAPSGVRITLRSLHG